MFKDIYKQANDKIDTQSAKSRVIAKLNKPMPVKRSVSVAKIAALAACFVLTIAVAGVYEQVQKDELPVPVPPVVATPKTAENTAEDSQVVVESGAETPPILEKKPEPTAKPQSSPEATKKAQALKGDEQRTVRKVHIYPENTPVVAEIDALPENTIEETPVTESASTPQPQAIEALTDESADVAQKASGGSGGGSARQQSGLVINNTLDEDMTFAVRAMPDKNEKEVSVLEYCEYLGKNIPEVVSAAVDMTNETTDTQMLEVDETGEYTDDSYEFLFTKEDKVLKIETTKQTEKIKEKIENPDLVKSKIGETDAVVMAENDVMKAYFTADEIGYTITSVNCEEILVEELLFSLN